MRSMYKVDLNITRDLRKLRFKYQQSTGHTNGMLPKATAMQGDRLLYIKLGQFNRSVGFYGIEPVIELINSRIGQMLGFPVLDYRLYRQIVTIDGAEYTTLAQISFDYQRVKSKNNVVNIYNKEDVEIMFHQGLALGKWNTTLDMMMKLGLLQQIYEQFVYDYLICNMDRHGKNNEILIDRENKANMRLAPFFDNSLTVLLQRYGSGYVDRFKYNDRMPVNNFIGSNNLLDNVMIINSPVYVKRLTKDSRQAIFQGLQSVTTRRFRDYTWEMINSRIESLQKLGNNNIVFI